MNGSQPSGQSARQKAAALIADNRLDIDAIAKKTGVTRRTIARWRNDKTFQDLIRTSKDLWREKARNAGIADPDWRQRNRNDRYRRLRAIIDARAANPSLKDVPGGRTGLIKTVFKMQSLGEGQGSQAIPEYSVDDALLAAMLELERDSATEEGQWKQPQEEMSAAQASVAMNLTVTFVRPDQAPRPGPNTIVVAVPESALPEAEFDSDPE